MNIYLEDELIFSLSDDEIKIIEYAVEKSKVSEDIKRRITWVIRDQHLGTRAREMRKEWEPKLIASGAKSLPVDDVEFARLVWADPNYKDASKKNEEREDNHLINSKESL